MQARWRFSVLLFWLSFTFFGVASGREVFELRVQLRFEDDSGRVREVALLILEAVGRPFVTHKVGHSKDEFKFKKLPTGVYRLIVFIGTWGEMEKSIEVGPSRADEKGRISEEVLFDPRRRTSEGQTVTPAELQIPDKAWDEYGKAFKKLSQEETEEAIKHLETAIELAPQFSTALNRLGTIHFSLRQYEEAESCFRRAHEQDPEAFPPLVNLGGATLTLGNLDEALTLNQEAVKRRPDDPLAHSQLGQTFFALNRHGEAEQHLKTAISLDPGHFSFPQLLLAEIYWRQGKQTEMIEVLESFLNYHPDSPPAPSVIKILERYRTKPEQP